MPPLPIIGAGTLTIGASAPIFGLLGGLMYYSRRGGSSLVRSAVMGYVMSAVMFGILMPGIDNCAHAGGFAGGYLAGKLLDPLKPERTDHMVIAAACLAPAASPSPFRSSPHSGRRLMRYFGGRRPNHRLTASFRCRGRNHFEYRSMMRAIPRRHAAQKPTRLRVNMMQSACERYSPRAW